MKLLDKCKDYKILENKLDADTLNKIDKVLVHFENYVEKKAGNSPALYDVLCLVSRKIQILIQ